MQKVLENSIGDKIKGNKNLHKKSFKTIFGIVFCNHSIINSAYSRKNIHLNKK
jgi:hypothetical protein